MKQLIQNFIKKVEENGNLVEAICYSNSEGIVYCKHYIPRLTRNIYSHSKSFTSTMVGIAIDEGMISFDTRLVDVFRDEIDDENYKRLYDIKLIDLLTMRSGFGKAYLMTDQRKSGQGYPDYLQYMFTRELLGKPGELFAYSNGDTYLCARMVQKVYNRDFRDLCYEKIFVPLEIGFPSWGVDPLGYCLAATSLDLNVEDMNKLGILYLNKGAYKGKRIVSEKFVNMAGKEWAKDPNAGWGHYGLQWWTVPEGNGYRADGMFGQITIVWPEHDAVLSFQRMDDERMHEVKKVLDEEILSKIK